MEITFRTRKLEKLANDYPKCQIEFGVVRAKLYNRNLPGHFHELVGDRKGQWACDLDQPYRLVFEPHEDPIPTDAHGRYIWFEVKGVEVIEIIDYH